MDGVKKKDLAAYLQSVSLGGGAPLEQAQAVVARFQRLSSDEPREVFISELPNAHDDNEVPSLWVFSERFCMEARRFLDRSFADFDLSPIAGTITYLGVEASGDCFENGADAKSTMTVEVQTSGRIYSQLSARGFNCDHLVDIVTKRLAPNLRQSD